MPFKAIADLVGGEIEHFLAPLRGEAAKTEQPVMPIPGQVDHIGYAIQHLESEQAKLVIVPLAEIHTCGDAAMALKGETKEERDANWQSYEAYNAAIMELQEWQKLLMEMEGGNEDADPVEE